MDIDVDVIYFESCGAGFIRAFALQMAQRTGFREPSEHENLEETHAIYIQHNYSRIHWHRGQLDNIIAWNSTLSNRSYRIWVVYPDGKFDLRYANVF